MSRTITNPAFAKLIKKKSIEMEYELFVPDIAFLCKCHPHSLHFYTTGRRKMPKLEARMAKEFNLTVPQLRRKLFPYISKPKNNNSTENNNDSSSKTDTEDN